MDARPLNMYIGPFTMCTRATSMYLLPFQIHITPLKRPVRRLIMQVKSSFDASRVCSSNWLGTVSWSE